jgi:hypothetical protein
MLSMFAILKYLKKCTNDKDVSNLRGRGGGAEGGREREKKNF